MFLVRHQELEATKNRLPIRAAVIAEEILFGETLPHRTSAANPVRDQGTVRSPSPVARLPVGSHS
jgi:hypothetical protein